MTCTVTVAVIHYSLTFMISLKVCSGDMEVHGELLRPENPTW